MKRLLLLAIIIMVAPTLTPATDLPVTPNGIFMIPDYRGWDVIAPSYRKDKNHIRVIFGNPVAIKAMKEKIRPFPDGTVLAKVAWDTAALSTFPVATVPAAFSQVEFMVKNADKYRETGGWGFARFVGKELKPYGKDSGFVRECFGCHQPVKGNDFVFTSLADVP